VISEIYEMNFFSVETKNANLKRTFLYCISMTISRQFKKRQFYLMKLLNFLTDFYAYSDEFLQIFLVEFSVTYFIIFVVFCGINFKLSLVVQMLFIVLIWLFYHSEL
jgi:hypothetical protein